MQTDGRSPTLETFALFLVVFLVQSAVGLVGVTAGWLFALGPGLAARPWTLVTSVYAHAGVSHLLANGLALALVGFPLERATSRLRFHLFFVTTGALAGLAQVAVGGTLAALGFGSPAAVLGASGAVFALYGYVVAGNRLADGLFARLDLDPRWQVGLFAAVAVVVTLATAAPGVALVAHFAGALLGLVAGRLGLLATGR